MSGQERHSDMKWNRAQARDEARSKKKALRAEHQETATCFRSHAEICDRCNDSQTKNNWGANDKWNVSTSLSQTRSCQHNDSQCCTSIWASARSLNTVSQSFHESALWKLILIPPHSYKFLFHTDSALTPSLVLHHRQKEYDLILPQGVKNTLTVKKWWHFNEPQTKAFTECVIIAANPKKQHEKSFAKPIKNT